MVLQDNHAPVTLVHIQVRVQHKGNRSMVKLDDRQLNINYAVNNLSDLSISVLVTQQIWLMHSPIV